MRRVGWGATGAGAGGAIEYPPPMRASPRLDVLACSLCLGVAAMWGWLWRQRLPDDAWTVLRYARNLIEGNGWVYNVGESVNASTSPLNTIAIAGLGFLFGDLTAAQVAVFVLGIGGAAACAFVAVRLRHGLFAGAVAATFILFAPLLHSTIGMESPLFLLGLTATWLAWSVDRYVLAAFLLGLFTLARPDAALLAPALLADRALRRLPLHDLPYWKMLAAGAVPILPWAVFASLQFGNPLPSTLAAKMAQGASGWWDHTLYFRGAKYSLEFFDSRDLFDSHRPMAVFLVLGAVATIVRRHAVLPIVVFEVLHSAAYAALGVPYYQWYASSLHLTFALVAAAMVGDIWCAERLNWVRSAIAIVAFGTYLWVTVPPLQVHRPSYQSYRAAATWIVENTPDDVSVGCLEIGCIGYFTAPRRIVDACGLVSPDGAPFIARRQFAWWFDHHEPDVVLIHDPPWGQFEADVLDRPRFRAHYRKTATPGHPEFHIWVRQGSADAEGSSSARPATRAK